MYDKTKTFKTVNEILKNAIIPKITDGIAKEQAIALVSVLKNLDKNTVENSNPKEQLIILINRTLNDYVQKIRDDSNNFTVEWVELLEESIKKTTLIENTTEKWKRLNEIQCQLFRYLYQEKWNNATIEQLYIIPLRKEIRKQLNIEMAQVR